MARKPQEEEKGGLPGWMGTYGDLVTLLLCFFVLLFAMSNVDVNKFKAAMSSFSDQIDVLPGGISLTGEELITNGISQINEIAVILENRNPTAADSEDAGTEVNADPSETDDTVTDDDRQAVIDAAKAYADDVADKFKEALVVVGLDTEVDIEATPNFVILTIKGKALFDSGQAFIKPEAEQIISVIARTYEEDYDQYSIIIEGHTDNKPMNTIRYPSNWYLSAARAIAVGEYLIEEVGIPDERISCTGYGEFQPIDDNNTVEGAAANRRVVVKINLGGVENFVEKETILDAPVAE